MSESFCPTAGRPGARASLDAVLRYAWGVGAFTSNDAMPAVGLTRSTTFEAIDALIGLGLIRELPNAHAVGQHRMGRPARRFELRADAGLVVGMDAGREHVTTIVADLRGRRRATVSIETERDAGGDQRRHNLDAALDATLDAAGAGRSDLLAVCVGVPAPVDTAGRSPVHPGGFWRKSNPDLLSHITPWAPIVRLENDASLAAVAEGSVGAAQHTENFVALLSGARFGMGVVVDGHLLRGLHGGAGETVVFDHVNGVGDSEGLGHTIARWSRQAVDSGAISPGHPLALLTAEKVTARHVFELAHAGDPEAGAIVAQASAMLSRITGVIGSVYDPEIVVVSGAVSAGIQDVVAAARETIPLELDLPAPMLVASTLGAEVVAIGAVSAAVEAARDGVLALTPQRSFAP